MRGRGAAHGTLWLSSPVESYWLKFSTGDADKATPDATLVFAGPVADVNTALSRLVYGPDPDWNSAVGTRDILNFEVADAGGADAGSGGRRVTHHAQYVHVEPSNDDPEVSVPAGPLSVDEDATLAISGVEVADRDAAVHAAQQLLALGAAPFGALALALVHVLRHPELI